MLAADYEKQLADIGGMRRRTLASAYYLRETNLALDIRKADTLKRPAAIQINEMKQLLKKDLANYNEERVLDSKNNPEWTKWNRL